MRVLNIQEAKTHLSRLVDAAVAGEEIVIAKAGRPQVRLTPCLREQAPRVPGDWKGRLWMASDFDETDEEMVRLFEGEEEGQSKPPVQRGKSPASKSPASKSPASKSPASKPAARRRAR